MTIAETIVGSATAAGVRKLLEPACAGRPSKKKGSHYGRKSAKKPTPGATEDRLANTLNDLRRTNSEDPAGEEFREHLFAELRKLIPIAIRQAKAGKPALLRILTRYSR